MSKKQTHHHKASHAHEAEAQADLAHEHDGDLILVPKGQSRFQFYFVWSLLIFVLLIFTVGGLFEQVIGGMFAGGGGTNVAMSWTDPDTDERIDVPYSPDWVQQKRALSRMWDIRIFIPQDAATEQQRASVSDEDTAMFFVFDALAEKAGIHVSDTELAQRLTATFGSDESMRAWANKVGTTPKVAGEDARKVMRVDKYKGFVQSAVAIADADRVTELWEEQHPEYAFQYVRLDAADYEEEAAADIPGDEELAAWFHGLPAFRHKAYFTDDMLQASIAWAPLDGTFDATALLEKYPAALPAVEGEDADADAEAAAEARAQGYYNQFSNVRFRIPEQEQDNEDGADEATTPASDRLFQSFDEVKEDCLREAPIYAALGAWLADFKTREGAGEEVDLATEAAALGLTFVDTGPETTRKTLEEAAGWGGRYIAGQLAFGVEGALLSRVVVEENSTMIARLDAKIPGQEPPFEDIRDDVGKEWAKEHAAEIAVDKLEALRASFGDPPTGDDVFLPTVDEATFAAKAAEAGFEVIDRPYLERYEMPKGDIVDAMPGDRYIRVTNGLFELEEGQVPAAEKDAQGTNAFLVRYAGTRSADLSKLDPRQLDALRQQAVREATTAFEDTYFVATSDFVRQKYGLSLRSWEDEGE